MSLLVLLPFAAAVAAAADDDQARNPLGAAHKFADCIVRAAPGESRQLLTMDYQSQQYGTLLASIVNGPAQRCQKRAKNIKIGGSLLAGMMAEALLSARFTPAIPVEQLSPNPKRAPIPVRNQPEVVAACTISAAPRAASRLLATEPGSAAEAKAFDVLAPTITGCLKKGENMRAERPTLRAIMSLVAWRMVSAEKNR